ncbi:hypothetical protein [Nocardioides hwasunensis]|uniref:Uncharacterized protein n=1 Tax=Nocardioides hwasunensis TaxID=397258 RepID=A0ABR8MB78_9ACTN|nr:hypothetical protein [Nocardioides hwasunensis]MBD3913392.1 hypothetical protein [Nocardioides hwasunensis]
MATIAHLAGNPSGWRGDGLGQPTALVVASALMGGLALILLVRPGRRALGATAALVLVTLWLELPNAGNHWLLMGFVAAASLLSLARSDSWQWFSRTGRWIFFGFYCFAAFAKLNAGFFDPTTSCGVFYANQSLASFGLPTMGSESPLARIAVAGPVLTELSVPVLLAFSRTRHAGVLLALIFHSVISLDLDQHFYDFTSALAVLLCLFLPESTTTRLEERATRPSLVRHVTVVLAAVLVGASLLPSTYALAVVVLRVVAFVLWVPFAIWLIAAVARDGLHTTSLPMRLRGVAAWGLVTVVVLNGLTPYLEVKTAVGFNMYANLVTVAGESNHFVVPRTLHLSSVQDDLVEIVDSDDPALEVYAREGYLLPERNLLHYLAEHPDSTVSVRDGDGERSLAGADGVPLPLVITKLQPFRAVDTQNPPRCQAVWLSAL